MALISPFRIQCNSVLYQTKISRKMTKILQILWNPEPRIRVGFCRFSWGSNHFINEIPCHIKHYNMDYQAQLSEVPYIIMHDLRELAFKDKTPRDIKHSWLCQWWFRGIFACFPFARSATTIWDRSYAKNDPAASLFCRDWHGWGL